MCFLVTQRSALFTISSNLMHILVPLVSTPLGVDSKVLMPLSFLCKSKVESTLKKWRQCQVDQMPSGADKSFNPVLLNWSKM